MKISTYKIGFFGAPNFLKKVPKKYLNAAINLE